MLWGCKEWIVRVFYKGEMELTSTLNHAKTSQLGSELWT